MALDMKQTSQWWYARLKEGGKMQQINLGIKIAGQRPPSISERGDKRFEQSRKAAKKEHDRIIQEFKRPRSEEELYRKIADARNEQSHEFALLEDLPDSWASFPREKKLSPKYLKTSKNVLHKFVGFMKTQYPDIEELISVRREHVKAFMKVEEDRGVSARTWNYIFGLLKTAFRNLQPESDAYRRYLATAPRKKQDIIHRMPFKDEEVEAILEAAREDDFIRPLIVTALSTAMRRADCARLEWSDIDMDEKYISVKTGKTGSRVEIPILPMLYAELEHAGPKKTGYVFPDAAEMYANNPSGLNWRLRKVLRRAGFADSEDSDDKKRNLRERKEDQPRLPDDELRKRGLTAIDECKATVRKKKNMRAIFTAYMDGKTTTGIAKDLGYSKSTVSNHLNEISKMVGSPVVRSRGAVPGPDKIRGSIYAGKGDGNRLRRGSIRGWHSFRTTFVTKALSAGMPMELVRRVTGHSTVDVVINNYFHPDKEAFRKAMEDAMPDMLKT